MRLKINNDKSKMLVARKDQELHAKVKLNIQGKQEVSEFKYLGVMVCADRGMEGDS